MTLVAFGFGVVVGALYHPFFKPLIVAAWTKVKSIGNGKTDA